LITLCTSDTSPSTVVRRALDARPKRKLLSIERLEGLVHRGLAGGWLRPMPWAGEDRFRRHFRADLSMDCEGPYEYTLYGRYDRRNDMGRAIFVTMKTRCRKCEPCRERRSLYWSARAMTEYDRWPSTYMVTLTLRPEVHYYFDAKVHEALRPKHAIEASEGRLAPATLYAYRARVLGAEVTKYLKRVRKRAPFRYLLVAEAHKNAGAVFKRPHFHLLIHEVETGTLVKPHERAAQDGMCHTCGRLHYAGELCDHAFLRTRWEHGFTKAVLAYDSKSVYYLCKYISKDMQARVRASIDYGEERLSPNALNELGLGPERRSEGGKLTPKKDPVLTSGLNANGFSEKSTETDAETDAAA